MQNYALVHIELHKVPLHPTLEQHFQTHKILFFLIHQLSLTSVQHSLLLHKADLSASHVKAACPEAPSDHAQDTS